MVFNNHFIFLDNAIADNEIDSFFPGDKYAKSKYSKWPKEFEIKKAYLNKFKSKNEEKKFDLQEAQEFGKIVEIAYFCSF